MNNDCTCCSSTIGHRQKWATHDNLWFCCLVTMLRANKFVLVRVHWIQFASKQMQNITHILFIYIWKTTNHTCIQSTRRRWDCLRLHSHSQWVFSPIPPILNNMLWLNVYTTSMWTHTLLPCAILSCPSAINRQVWDRFCVSAILSATILTRCP
jgi:hypothetical protein